jgi:hypothetical protein
MIKTRIASGAALFTFGFAALGGAVVAVAAPANAAPSHEHDAGSTSTSAHASSPSKPSREAHLIPPGLKPSGPAHVIPGFKPQPITPSASNGPTATVGSTPTSTSASAGTNPADHHKADIADTLPPRILDELRQVIER